MSTMTLEEGLKVLNAALAYARSMGVTVAVAVVDARGDLVTSARMDGSLWWWIESSRAKAMATVTFGGVPSGQLIGRSTRPVAQMLVYMHDGRLAAQQGAVPIKRGGQLIGSVGTAGGTSLQDEKISAAGAVTIS